MLQDILTWLQTAGVKHENTVEQKQLGFNLIEEELDELKEAKTKEDVLDAIVDLYWMVTNNIVFQGLTLQEVEQYINKVSTSNWSKFCTTEACAKQTVEAYAKGEHWDKPEVKIDCYYERVDSVWIVKRTSDNKILKSLYYKPVNKL